MKKYFFYAIVLFLGLTSLSVRSAWGQDADYSSKYWTKAVSVLEKDPEKDGRKVFEKTFAGQLSLWSSDTTQIAVMKKGLVDVLDRLANSNEGPKAYSIAVDVIFEQLKDVIQSDAKEVVRINAVIMLGELNSSQKRGEKEVPYVKARSVLKELLKSKELPIQISALRGLARHAKLGVRAEEKEDLSKIFAQYAFVPPSKGDAIGAPETQWMRIISLEALGDLGIAGSKSEIAMKLLESVSLQSKTLESPYFRRDMDRRITSALAFAKIRIDADALREMKRKPTEVTELMTKLFLQCMIYEYNTDIQLQNEMGGEEMMGGQPVRQNIVRTLTPEEEALQIRLWKQRTKAISSVFAWIFTNKASNLSKLEEGNANFLKTARKIRDISMMYDRAGLPEKKRASRTEEGEEGMAPMPVESSVQMSDGRLSLYKMQNDMRKALTELAEEAGINVNIPKKQRTQNELY